MTMEEGISKVLEPYIIVCKYLGVRPVVNHMLVLEYLTTKKEPFAVVDIVKDLNIQRSSAYTICLHLEEMGFIQLVDRGAGVGQLPPEADEWLGKHAKSRLAKRLGLRKPKSYIFTPWNSVKAIDEKIQELEKVKEWLRSLKGE